MGQKRRKKGRDQRRRIGLASAVAPTSLQVMPGSVIVAPAPPTELVTEPVAVPTNGSDTQLMRRDLMKVATVVTVVIGVLVALVLTNRQSGWLDRIAGELYRWLRLG